MAVPLWPITLPLWILYLLVRAPRERSAAARRLAGTGRAIHGGNEPNLPQTQGGFRSVQRGVR
jgi:hypothetical protein